VSLPEPAEKDVLIEIFRRDEKKIEYQLLISQLKQLDVFVYLIATVCWLFFSLLKL